MKIDDNGKLATTSSYAKRSGLTVYYNPNTNKFTTTKTNDYEVLMLDTDTGTSVSLY